MSLPKVTVIVCCKQSGDAWDMVESIRQNCCLTTDELDVSEVTGATSMAEGYHLGEKRADKDSSVLVFTHSDVDIWAGRRMWKEMIACALHPNTGFVGVAGTTRIGPEATWWHQPSTTEYALRGAVAHEQGNDRYMTSFGRYGRAVVMDGVFLACSRSLIQRIGGWGGTGFHFYDIETTLKAHLAGFENRVIPFPICHRSVGKIKPEWHEARKQFLAKYGAQLPISL